MSFTIVYWHWLVLGMILILAEIFVPSFTILWFGLGAVVMAVVLLAAPAMSVAWQLFVWALASCIFTFLWFKYFRPLMADRTKAGISREAALGECGQVVKAPGPGVRGVVRFTTPLLGSDEWRFICEQNVCPGDRICVKDISGNTLIMEKRES